MSEDKINDIDLEIESLKEDIDIGVEKIMDNSQDMQKDEENCNAENLQEKLERLKMDVRALKEIKKHQKKIEKLEEKKIEILNEIEERRRRDKKRIERMDKRKRKH